MSKVNAIILPSRSGSYLRRRKFHNGEVDCASHEGQDVNALGWRALGMIEPKYKKKTFRL